MIVFDFARPQTLPIQKHADGNNYVLQDTVRVVVGSDGCPLVVEIPAGYKADLTSTPKDMMLVGFHKTGAHAIAALVHDYMFQTQAGYELANAVMFQLLKKLGMPNWRAGIMSFWCEAGGKERYKQYAKAIATAKAEGAPGTVI